MQDFDTFASKLLATAGGGAGLDEAADLLGIPPYALHAKILTHSALGVVLGQQLLLPWIQFVEDHDRTTIVPGLAEVLAVFAGAGAGPWGTLEFLTGRNPVLEEAPIVVLKAGKAELVTEVARGYLGLEG